MSSSFVKGFRSARGSIRPPAGRRRRRSRPGRATAAAAGRREPRRQMAPRSSGSAAPARRRARRVAAHRSSPFGCAARQQPPTATLAPNGRSGEVFPPCSVTQRREFTRLGSSWPVVISLPEWLLLAGRLSRDSGAYSVTTWVTRRPDSGRLGKEIGSWLRPFRVGHVAQAAADRDWCAQESLMAARAGVGG